MRISRSSHITARLALGASLALVAGISAFSMNASAVTVKPQATMPVVPASAGHITNGVAKVFYGNNHAKPASVKAAGPSNNLVYGGGSAAGTVSTAPAVYLVFYGSQWSASDGLAAYLQDFMRGLYGTGDDWTNVAKQYCQGALVAGSQTCPVGAQFVGAATGGLLKGVWFDNATPAIPADTLVNPTTNRTGDQIAAEAVRAAAHFGNTVATKNTNAQYVIATPSHFNTVGYGYYCAYHSAATSNYGSVAYTNLPYMTDLGASCGQNAINSDARGNYDGVSIVEGHEFMETITDMRPSTGWTDSGGQENGDKCAWIYSGPGHMENLTLSTGRFAVQSTWSNSINGCAVHG